MKLRIEMYLLGRGCEQSYNKLALLPGRLCRLSHFGPDPRYPNQPSLPSPRLSTGYVRVPYHYLPSHDKLPILIHMPPLKILLDIPFSFTDYTKSHN